MIQTDQIQTNNAGISDHTFSEQGNATAGTLCAGSVAAIYNFQLPVISRFPDLDAPVPSSGHKHHSSKSRSTKKTTVSSRLVSAGLSLKLLMGMGVALLVMAIAPYMVMEFTDNTQPQTEEENQQAWQPSPPVHTAEASPFLKPETTLPSSPSSPQIDVSAGISTSTPLTTTAKLISADLLPGTKLATAPDNSRPSSAWPRESGEQADFSSWPNPAHPLVEQSYLADRRNVPIPGGFTRLPPPQAAKSSATIRLAPANEPSTVRFEGVIETPSERNAYELRPSLH